MPEQSAIVYNIAIGILFGLIIAILSYKAKFLTKDGAGATFILAVGIYGFGGWQWTVPILIFFVLSSLLSKIRKKKNREIDLYFDKTGRRDAFQVFANGGFGLILVTLNLIYQDKIFFIVYVSIIAAVCSDTWATEIGTMKKNRTYNIYNFRPVEQGRSGGVSILGLGAALTASLVIAFSGSFWIEENLGFYFFIVALSGFLGSLFDSFLGATIQLQYICKVCKKITERNIHCGEKTNYYKGLKFLNNDFVNLLAGFFGGFVSFVLYKIIY